MSEVSNMCLYNTDIITDPISPDSSSFCPFCILAKGSLLRKTLNTQLEWMVIAMLASHQPLKKPDLQWTTCLREDRLPVLVSGFLTTNPILSHSNVSQEVLMKKSNSFLDKALFASQKSNANSKNFKPNYFSFWKLSQFQKTYTDYLIITHRDFF